MSKIYDEYLKRKKIDKNKLYLFSCGNFYIFIADDCDYINNYVVLKKVKFTNEVYKCGFPKTALQDYMRVFQNHNLDIEIIDDERSSLEEKLRQIDINSLTPIEALLKLKELQDFFK